MLIGWQKELRTTLVRSKREEPTSFWGPKWRQPSGPHRWPMRANRYHSACIEVFEKVFTSTKMKSLRQAPSRPTTRGFENLMKPIRLRHLLAHL